MVAMSMPFVATLGDPTTVHANRDLLETDKTAAKVSTRTDITWRKVHNEMVELAKVK